MLRFTAWKLCMQAIRQKKKEDKDKCYSTTKGKKLYKRNLMKQKGWKEDMVDPCKVMQGLHGHLCRSGAYKARVSGDGGSDKAADNKS